MFWVTFFLWLAFTIAGELLRPKPKFDKPQPSALGDFSVPTAEEGRSIPWVWGTCLVKGANVTWYGDLEARPIKKKVKTGIFSSTKITTGYQYFLGMQMAICLGEIDELLEMRVGEKKPNYSISTVGDKLRLDVNDPELFGGNKDGKEGGVVGLIDLYTGTATQTGNDYLAGVLGKNVPGYRGVCHAILRKVNLGNTAYLKHIHWLVRRCPNTLGLTGGAHNINGDANAACIIWEIMTDARAGLGIPPTAIDVVDLRAVGQVIGAEDLGLSMMVDTPASAADLLNEILRHIDGVLFTDPETGLIRLKLARADYDVEDLPVFNTSNVSAADFSRGSWAETKNTVKISYTDRAQDFQTKIAQAQDLANVQGRDGEISIEQIPYRGFSRASVAGFAAARALKTLAYPLARVHLTTNRSAWRLRPGSVFVFDWPPFGISGLVCRVIKIRYGNLEDGAIEIDAVEDIFAVTNTAYADPPATEWVNPYSPPSPAIDTLLLEAPYHIVGGAFRYVMALAERNSGIDEGFAVFTDPAGGSSYAQTEEVPTFTPVGELVGALPRGPAVIPSLVIQEGRDVARLESITVAEFNRGEQFLAIGDEILAFQSIVRNGDGTATLGTVWRAIFDTVPTAHSAGAKIWFVTGGVGLTDDEPYPADLTLSAKLLPFNRLGTVPIGDVSADTITTSSRALKPYPPGAVTVNGLAYPSAAIGTAALAWAHRHRVEQLEGLEIVSQAAPSYTATPEGDYRVRIYVGASLVRTDSGVSGTGPVNFTPAERAAASADGTLSVRLELEGVNGALVSRVQKNEFIMTGLGMTLGEYLGGLQA